MTPEEFADDVAPLVVCGTCDWREVGLEDVARRIRQTFQETRKTRGLLRQIGEKSAPGCEEPRERLALIRDVVATTMKVSPEMLARE